jgi:hypothetical protein
MAMEGGRMEWTTDDGRIAAFERWNPSLLSGQAVGTLERLAISGWGSAGGERRIAMGDWRLAVGRK